MSISLLCAFFFNDTAATEIYTLSLHDVFRSPVMRSIIRLASTTVPCAAKASWRSFSVVLKRSEEHTSELQSLRHLVCRLLLEKKKRQWTAGMKKDGEEVRRRV